MILLCMLASVYGRKWLPYKVETVSHLWVTLEKICDDLTTIVTLLVKREKVMKDTWGWVVLLEKLSLLNIHHIIVFYTERATHPWNIQTGGFAFIYSQPNLIILVQPDFQNTSTWVTIAIDKHVGALKFFSMVQKGYRTFNNEAALVK